MSDWHPEVVRVTSIEKHDNADSLEIAMVYGTTPVVIRKGSYEAGDLAAYIPVDTVVPDLPCFAFLTGSERRKLKAKRLRGVFSMGLLVEAPPDHSEGDSVVEALGLTKYEEPEPSLTGPARTRIGPKQKWNEVEPPPFRFPLFTDVEGYRRHPDALEEGEIVIITEKIHGSNARYVHDGAQLHAGSRTTIRDPGGPHAWGMVAQLYNLQARLAAIPMIAIYGEVYGPRIQDLTYSVDAPSFVVFDAFDCRAEQWLSAAEVVMLARQVGLATPPILYAGPWNRDCLKLAEGSSVLAKENGGTVDHTREGFVVRPVRERFAARLPDHRVVLKHVGEGYLTRKEKPVTESLVYVKSAPAANEAEEVGQEVAA